MMIIWMPRLFNIILAEQNGSGSFIRMIRHHQRPLSVYGRVRSSPMGEVVAYVLSLIYCDLVKTYIDNGPRNKRLRSFYNDKTYC